MTLERIRLTTNYHLAVTEGSGSGGISYLDSFCFISDVNLLLNRPEKEHYP